MNKFNFRIGTRLNRNYFNGYHFTRNEEDDGNILTEFTTFEGLKVRMVSCHLTSTISFFFEDGSAFIYVLGKNSIIISKQVIAAKVCSTQELPPDTRRFDSFLLELQRVFNGNQLLSCSVVLCDGSEVTFSVGSTDSFKSDQLLRPAA